MKEHLKYKKKIQEIKLQYTREKLLFPSKLKKKTVEKKFEIEKWEKISLIKFTKSA